MRLIATTAVALFALPTFAHAATRPIQAFDQAVGFAPVWAPSELAAQPGDIIRWQFDQPGNANATGSSHDLFLTRPGRTEEKLGVSYLNPVIEATVDEAGTYAFRCSIHPDSMRGSINVAAGDATPVVDPGRPWESSAPPIVTDNGPAPLLNSAAPPAALEAGDFLAPTLRLLKVTSTRRAARVRVRVSEAGTLYARVFRRGRAVSTAHFAVQAGNSTVSVKLPKRRDRLAVWVRDRVQLESARRYKRL